MRVPQAFEQAAHLWPQRTVPGQPGFHLRELRRGRSERGRCGDVLHRHRRVRHGQRRLRRDLHERARHAHLQLSERLRARGRRGELRRRERVHDEQRRLLGERDVHEHGREQQLHVQQRLFRTTWRTLYSC